MRTQDGQQTAESVDKDAAGGGDDTNNEAGDGIDDDEEEEEEEEEEAVPLFQHFLLATQPGRQCAQSGVPVSIPAVRYCICALDLGRLTRALLSRYASLAHGSETSMVRPRAMRSYGWRSCCC